MYNKLGGECEEAKLIKLYPFSKTCFCNVLNYLCDVISKQKLIIMIIASNSL